MNKYPPDPTEGLVSDRLARLAQDRDRLEAAMPDATPQQLPSLVLAHVKVLEQIDALTPPKQKGTPLDQLAERRRARGAETAGADEAEGSSRRR